MKKMLFTALAMSLFFAVPAHAHFGMVLPDKNVAMEKKDANISVQFIFTHPFEGKAMDLEVEKAQVFNDGKATDITSTLKPETYKGKKAFKTSYKLAKPGVYTIAMTPKPYWEPAEDKFIIHYTKTVVAAFGEEEGWDQPVGLPVEIVPLSRPFGLYAGNTFRGKVLVDGKPGANLDVEVEYLNGSAGTFTAPSDYSVTQVVKTDENGIFTYSTPCAGWFGFAALTDGPSKIAFEGKDRDVELGGVFWAKFDRMQPAK